MDRLREMFCRLLIEVGDGFVEDKNARAAS